MSEWNKLVGKDKLDELKQKMIERGFNALVVDSKNEALEKLKELIPEGSEVSTGSSTTLKEIGYIEYLNSNEDKHQNLNTKTWAENDELKRNDLRRKATAAEYFVSSMNAVTEEGVLVAVDATGSRVGSILFAAKNVVLVISGNKIVKDVDSAFDRIRQHVFPLEDKRMMGEYGFGSSTNKWIIIEKEVQPERIHVILVGEELGF